jgi:hypothetical protein
MPFFSILHTTYLTSNTKTIFDIPSELLIGWLFDTPREVNIWKQLDYSNLQITFSIRILGLNQVTILFSLAPLD